MALKEKNNTQNRKEGRLNDDKLQEKAEIEKNLIKKKNEKINKDLLKNSTEINKDLPEVNNDLLKTKNTSKSANFIWNIMYIMAFYSLFRIIHKCITSLSLSKYSNDFLWKFLYFFIFFISCLASSYSFFYFGKVKSYQFKAIFLILKIFIFSYIPYKYFNGVILRSSAFISVVFFTLKIYSYLFGYEDQVTVKTEIPFKYYSRFIYSPAIVFRHDYKIRKEIRYKNLIFSIFKTFFFSTFGLFVLSTAFEPIADEFLKENNIYSKLEKFLYLSVCTVILFSSFFGFTFMGYLSMLNEISGFDVKLYGEWWNSHDASEFWRNWNIPIHNFIKIHVYDVLCEKRKINRNISRLLCVVFSAIIHEIIVSLTIRRFNKSFMVAMLAQTPLHYLTSNFKKFHPELAKIVFFFLFSIFGQTLLFLVLFKEIRHF